MLQDIKFSDGASALRSCKLQSTLVPAPQVAPVAERGAQDISVELARGARLAEIRPSWIDLLARADTPNVFMDPMLLRIAGDAYPETGCMALLAWRQSDGQAQLVGVWAFSVGAARKAALPIRLLSAPAMVHGFAATPVIDRAFLEDTFDAMLDRIAIDRHLPNIILLDAMATDGPTMAALSRVLASRGSVPRILDRSRRPKLESDLDAKAYWEQALSSSSRKKLRQHRRRLSEKGVLASTIARELEAVRRALEEFMAMEAAGWKGRQGTALLCHDADAAFTRAAVGALAEQGCASIHALYLDRRPVSMQIVLTAGAAAFTWKTAYDEKLHDVSPGMLLLEDYTAAFLNDPSIASVNSCAYDDSGFMSAWTEREQIATLWINARRGGSAAFEILWRLQKSYSGLRAMAKNAYWALRRQQRAAKS